MKLSPQTIAANISAAAAAEMEEQAAAAAAAAGNSNSISTASATANNNNISATAAATVSTASVTNATSISSTLPGVHGSSSSAAMNQQALSGQQTHQLQANQQMLQQAQAQQTPPNPPGKSAPKDTQVVAAILKEMGITEYEPRVLPQLVEFAYRKCTTVCLVFPSNL